jgi:hypothetical protein
MVSFRRRRVRRKKCDAPHNKVRTFSAPTSPTSACTSLARTTLSFYHQLPPCLNHDYSRLSEVYIMRTLWYGQLCAVRAQLTIYLGSPALRRPSTDSPHAARTPAEAQHKRCQESDSREFSEGRGGEEHHSRYIQPAQLHSRRSLNSNKST